MAFAKSKSNTNKDIDCKVKKKFGVLSENGDYKTELRFVSWNGNEPKYDIRPWKKEEDGTETCRKGIALTGEEAEKLYELLKKIAED